jgi:hypothetical protein
MLVATLLAAVSMGPSCGSDFGDKGTGEPCTRDGECLEGLECVGGTCRAPSTTDAAQPVDGDTDAGLDVGTDAPDGDAAGADARAAEGGA